MTGEIEQVKTQEPNLSDLLGITKATGEPFQGDSNRLSYEQAIAVRELSQKKFPGTFPENERASYIKLITDGIRAIGDRSLKGAKLAEFCEIVDIWAAGFNEQDDMQLFGMANVAYKLSYATAFLEGNLPPNSLGYIPDQSVSIPRKDEKISDDVHEAKEYIESLICKKMVEGEKEWKELYNAVVDRLEPQRSILVNSKALPRFEL